MKTIYPEFIFKDEREMVSTVSTSLHARQLESSILNFRQITMSSLWITYNMKELALVHQSTVVVSCRMTEPCNCRLTLSVLMPAIVHFCCK